LRLGFGLTPIAQQMLTAVITFKLRSLIVYAFLGTIYACGLRPFEVAGLAPWDVDLPESGPGWVRVRGGRPGGIATRWYDVDDDLRSGPKGQAVTEVGRVVPIPSWWVNQLRWILAKCPSKNGIVFCTENGTSPTPSNINRAWKRAKDQVQPKAAPGEEPNPLNATRPYDLRHARATEWLRIEGHNKAALARIAEWMGHSVEVLLSIYTNPVSGDIDASVAAMEAAAPDWRGPAENGLPRFGEYPGNAAPEVGSPAIQEGS
jgi:integrase